MFELVAHQQCEPFIADAVPPLKIGPQRGQVIMHGPLDLIHPN